jgi:hypothetical protein
LLAQGQGQKLYGWKKNCMDTFMQNSSSTFGQLEGQKIGIKYVLKYFGKKSKSIKFLVIFPTLRLK